jgi:hypothetical protein
VCRGIAAALHVLVPYLSRWDLKLLHQRLLRQVW